MNGAAGNRLHTPLSSLPGFGSHAWSRYRGPILDGLAIGGIGLLVYLLVHGGYGFDLFAYWNVDPGNPYAIPTGFGHFHYSPPAAWLALPLKPFSFEAAFWVYLGVQLAALLVIGGRYGLAWLAFPPVAIEMYHGNIHLLLALAVWLGFRLPWTWSFVLLTKVSSGVGLLWFAVRREWWSLALAVGVTAGLVIVWLVIRPDLWQAWLNHMLTSNEIAEPAPNAIHVSTYLRIAVAALIVIWGARTDRRWTVALGSTLALPILWIHGLSMLVALTPQDRPGFRSGRAVAQPQTRTEVQ